MTINRIEATSLTRADLASAVQTQIGLSRAESAELVEMVLDEISDVLVAGDNVKISSFGSFVLRDKGLRVGRNPKTGVEVPIEPRTVLTFRPSQILRDEINKGGKSSSSKSAPKPGTGSKSDGSKGAARPGA